MGKPFMDFQQQVSLGNRQTIGIKVNDLLVTVE
jgi:hypothetical protein